MLLYTLRNYNDVDNVTTDVAFLLEPLSSNSLPEWNIKHPSEELILF